MKQDAASPLSTAVRAEAAAWVARLHSASRTPELESGLRKWLQSNPAHVRAFELATEAWEIGGAIPGGALPRMARPSFTPPPATRPRVRHLAIAAGVLVAVIGAVFYLKQQAPPITTAVGEQRSMALSDGTRIFLNTDTLLFVREDATQRQIRLEKGEAWFDVARDPQRPFVVTAGDKEVIALGTSFLVRREQQQLTVTLIKGKVAVSSAAGAHVDGGETRDGPPADSTVLAPGQRLTVVSHEPPKVDEPAIDNLTAWRRGEVILDKTRLRDAVDEMNRYSAVRLVIDDAAADIAVSGIFRAGDSASFARAVAETYHLAIDKTPDRILIYAPPAPGG